MAGRTVGRVAGEIGTRADGSIRSQEVEQVVNVDNSVAGDVAAGRLEATLRSECRWVRSG